VETAFEGTARVPRETLGVPQTDYSPLSSWYRYQRSQYKLYSEGGPSSLSKDQIRQLKELGIDKFKDIRDQKWHEMLEQLKEVRDEHGHCRVSQQYPPNATLGNYVRNISKPRKPARLFWG